MKSILLTIVVLTLSTLPAKAGSRVSNPQANDSVEPIRQHYASINKEAAHYRRVKKNLLGFSAEGGELVAYFHGPTIMKMVATFFGETGRSIEEYYFWNEKLIFVFQTESRYDKPFGKVVRKIENRFYFKDDKLIRWLDENGKEVAPDSAEYASKQADYLKTSKQFVEGAKSKAAMIESP